MEDDELRQIREARLRELKRQNPNAGGAPDADKRDEMRAAVLPQLLTQDARERLNRVRIVKPERADQVEQLIVRMGQTGQLAQKVSERELVTLLDQLAQRDQTSSKIVVTRRETDFDRDELPREPTSNSNAPESDDDDFFD